MSSASRSPKSKSVAGIWHDDVLVGANGKPLNLKNETAVSLWAEGSRENVRGQVDTVAPEGVRQFIGGLTKRGTAVVYSTHNVAEAERYADRVLVLADGELLFTGSPRDLERAVGARDRDLDFESAFVTFLHEHGH